MRHLIKSLWDYSCSDLESQTIKSEDLTSVPLVIKDTFSAIIWQTWFLWLYSTYFLWSHTPPEASSYCHRFPRSYTSRGKLTHQDLQSDMQASNDQVKNLHSNLNNLSSILSSHEICEFLSGNTNVIIKALFRLGKRPHRNGHNNNNHPRSVLVKFSTVWDKRLVRSLNWNLDLVKSLFVLIFRRKKEQ